VVPGHDAAPLICRGALPPDACRRWLAAAGSPGDPAPPSLLQAPAGVATDVLAALAASALRAPIEARLGAAPLCNLGQSRWRHGRPPHHWHQDGALRFDFIAHAGRPLPADALMPMLTCWIALTPCGEHAPGLQWAAAPTPALLMPGELTDTAVMSAHAATGFVQPCLQPGDAVLFDGTLLHRTHLTAQMTRQRTSLELRFFSAAALPQRVAGDVHRAWPAGRR
jgi:hypothetical protein